MKQKLQKVRSHVCLRSTRLAPRRDAIMLLALAMVWARSAAADEVRLTDGGSVLGRVVSESPTKGVVVLLRDGSSYSVPAALVKEVVYEDASANGPEAPIAKGGSTSDVPAPEPPQERDRARPADGEGTLRVSAASSGTVSVRSATERGARWERKGRVREAEGSIEVPLAEGLWEVEIEFDIGGGASQRAVVNPGALTKLRLGHWQEAPWVEAHRGAHFGLMGYFNSQHVPASDAVIIGPSGQAFANISLNEALELRVGGELGLAFIDGNATGSMLAFGSVVFNTPGGVYRPYLGAGAGTNVAVDHRRQVSGSAVTESYEPVFYPRIDIIVAPLHFGVGERREWSIDLRAPISIFTRHEPRPAVPAFSFGIGRVFY